MVKKKLEQQNLPLSLLNVKVYNIIQSSGMFI